VPDRKFSRPTILAAENLIFFMQLLLQKTIKKNRPFWIAGAKMDAAGIFVALVIVLQ